MNLAVRVLAIVGADCGSSEYRLARERGVGVGSIASAKTEMASVRAVAASERVQHTNSCRRPDAAEHRRGAAMGRD